MTNDTIDTLNKLIETSKDGEYGFRTSAEYAKDTELKQLFTQHARECRESAAELQALVAQRGENPEDSGSLSGAAHRGWVALKGTLSTHTDLAVLEDAERGEDTALDNYRQAMNAGLPVEAHAIVARQYEGVKRNHAQMRLLRDQARTVRA
jgi:uncharacterized protein (TIGR02284 family)